MKPIIYVLFLSIFFLDYFSLQLHILIRQATWIPELLSICALVLVVLHAATTRRFRLHAKYIALFFGFMALGFVSTIINDVSPGTTFVGLRLYLKYLPFFLVPAVFDFSEQEMRTQLKFLLALSILQLPLAVFQRMFQFRGLGTGDVISGTLNISSVLSIYLISCIAILVGSYLRREIPKSLFFTLLLVLFLPTTINETKGSLILFPIAVAVPVILMPNARSFAQRIGPLLLSAVLIFCVFVPMYNSFYASDGRGLLDFVTDEGQLTHYLYGGAASDKVDTLDDRPSSIPIPFEGPEARVGRIDGILLPLRILSDHPMKLLVGLGMGNVSKSAINEFSGRYAQYTQLGANVTVLSLLLWETGLIGVALALTTLFIVFRDACQVSRSEGFAGFFALGWTGVTAVMIGVMPYKNAIVFNVLGYLFWYFSGYVAAQRVRQASRIYREESGNPERPAHASRAQHSGVAHEVRG